MSIWIARLRAPKGANGQREPLYLTVTDPPTLLWQLSDEEAVALGSAIGAFGKYAPITQQQSALGIDIATLLECLVSITQQRLMVEAMFLHQKAQEQAAQAAGQEHREHPVDIPRHMDARSRLFS